MDSELDALTQSLGTIDEELDALRAYANFKQNNSRRAGELASRISLKMVARARLLLQISEARQRIRQAQEENQRQQQIAGLLPGAR